MKVFSSKCGVFTILLLALLSSSTHAIKNKKSSFFDCSKIFKTLSDPIKSLSRDYAKAYPVNIISIEDIVTAFSKGLVVDLSNRTNLLAFKIYLKAVFDLSDKEISNLNFSAINDLIKFQSRRKLTNFPNVKFFAPTISSLKVDETLIFEHEKVVDRFLKAIASLTHGTTSYLRPLTIMESAVFHCLKNSDCSEKSFEMFFGEAYRSFAPFSEDGHFLGGHIDVEFGHIKGDKVALVKNITSINENATLDTLSYLREVVRQKGYKLATSQKEDNASSFYDLTINHFLMRTNNLESYTFKGFDKKTSDVFLLDENDLPLQAVSFEEDLISPMKLQEVGIKSPRKAAMIWADYANGSVEDKVKYLKFLNVIEMMGLRSKSEHTELLFSWLNPNIKDYGTDFRRQVLQHIYERYGNQLIENDNDIILRNITKEKSPRPNAEKHLSKNNNLISLTDIIQMASTLPKSEVESFSKYLNENPAMAGEHQWYWWKVAFSNNPRDFILDEYANRYESSPSFIERLKYGIGSFVYFDIQNAKDFVRLIGGEGILDKDDYSIIEHYFYSYTKGCIKNACTAPSDEVLKDALADMILQNHEKRDFVLRIFKWIYKNDNSLKYEDAKYFIESVLDREIKEDILKALSEEFKIFKKLRIQQKTTRPTRGTRRGIRRAYMI